MKKLQPFFVPVSEIICDIPNTFDQVQVQQLSKLIVSSGGLLKPLVVQRLTFESYKLLAGAFEYYAAVEAKKVNSTQSNLINAYIIDAEDDPEFEPQKTQSIMEQLELFRFKTFTIFSQQPLNFDTQTMQEEIKQIIEQYSESMIERLNRLEQSLDTKLNTLTNSVEHLQKASTQTSHAPVTPKQTRKAVVMEAKTQEAKTQAPAKNIISSGDKFLDFINAATLQDLRNLGTDLYDSNLSAIIKKKKKDGPFKSIAEFEQWVAKNKTFSPILYSKFLAKWKEQESSASDSSNDSVESTTVTVQEEEDSSKPESASDDVAPPVEPVPTTPKKRSSKKNLRGIDKLNQMNQVELAQTLHRLKLSSKLIEAILEQRPFGSFETINIRGLGPKKVQIIQEEFDK